MQIDSNLAEWHISDTQGFIKFVGDKELCLALELCHVLHLFVVVLVMFKHYFVDGDVTIVADSDGVALADDIPAFADVAVAFYSILVNGAVALARVSEQIRYETAIDQFLATFEVKLVFTHANLYAEVIEGMNGGQSCASEHRLIKLVEPFDLSGGHHSSTILRGCCEVELLQFDLTLASGEVVAEKHDAYSIGGDVEHCCPIDNAPCALHIAHGGLKCGDGGLGVGERLHLRSCHNSCFLIGRASEIGAAVKHEVLTRAHVVLGDPQVHPRRVRISLGYAGHDIACGLDDEQLVAMLTACGLQ